MNKKLKVLDCLLGDTDDGAKIKGEFIKTYANKNNDMQFRGIAETGSKDPFSITNKSIPFNPRGTEG